MLYLSIYHKGEHASMMQMVMQYVYYLQYGFMINLFLSFVSEFDTNHILRMLSIPSDPFQELQYASCSCPPPWILENPEYLDWRVSAARLKYIPSGSPTFARLAVTLLFCQFPLAIDLDLVG